MSMNRPQGATSVSPAAAASASAKLSMFEVAQSCCAGSSVAWLRSSLPTPTCLEVSNSAEAARGGAVTAAMAVAVPQVPSPEGGHAITHRPMVAGGGVSREVEWAGAWRSGDVFPRQRASGPLTAASGPQTPSSISTLRRPM